MVSGRDKPPHRPTSTSSVPKEPSAAESAGHFGATLRRFRESRGLTQEQLAESSGMSVAAISTLERGTHRQPRKDTLHLLADALALPARDRAVLEAAAGYLQPAERPPIGREREWARLQSELAGERPLLLIVGRPGIGKTHLLGAAARFASAYGWRVLSAGCHRGSEQEPYAPVTEAIKRSVHDLLSEGKIAALGGGTWLGRLLPELVDKGVLAAPQQALPPDQERRLMFDAVVDYLESIGGEAGTLLVLDDVQWAGADTMLLLAHLIHSVHPGRIRILAAHRTTEVERQKPLDMLVGDLAKDDSVARLELAPLTSDDATHLASDLLRPLLEHADERVRRELAQGLVRRAHRIPLFMVQFAKSLGELAQERDAHAAANPALSGRSAREATGMRVSVADLNRMPWSIAQHVHLRLAALPSSTQDLLDVAAVAAEATSGEVLAECLGRSEREALPDFEAACASGLLTPIPARGGRVDYRFEHDLLREAVDETLSAERKLLLHRALGEALEHRLGDGLGQREDLFPRLAYHFARSGQPEKAATYLRRAGDQARRMYAHQQAARYYAELTTCLDELQSKREAADARRSLAGELAHVGRYAEELEELARAGETYRTLGDVEALAMVTADIASAHATRGTVRLGLTELLLIVEDIAVTRPDEQARDNPLSPAVRAWLLKTLSYLCFMSGRYEEALRAAERALDVAQVTGDATLIGQVRCGLGVALFAAGRAPEAAEVLRQSISCLETASNDELLVDSLLMATWVAQTQGDFARSRALQGRALAAAQEFGSPALIGHAFIFVGLLAFYDGEWDQARHLAMSSATALGALEGSPLGSYPPLGLGILCLVSGQRDEAMRHLDTARAIAEHSDGEQILRLMEALLAEDELVRGCGDAACARLDRVLNAGPLQERTRIELRTLRAWGALQMGRLAEAEAMALEAVQSARDHEMRLLLPDALRVQALCAIARHHWLLATDALEQALSFCQKMPYPYAEAKVRHVYGQLWLALGEPERAHAQFEQALAICARLGERMYGAAIEQVVAQVGGRSRARAVPQEPTEAADR